MPPRVPSPDEPLPPRPRSEKPAQIKPRIHHVIEDRSERVADAEVHEVAVARSALALADEHLFVAQVLETQVDLIVNAAQITAEVDVESAEHAHAHVPADRRPPPSRVEHLIAE